MLKWKRSLTVLAMTALLGTMAACGGNGNGNGATNKAEATPEPASTTAAATAAPSNEPVKLRIMWWGSQPRHEATLAALELYTKNNPNVTFEPEYSGMDGYLDKLSTQAAAKNAPDIVQLDPGWMPDWMSRGQLADLAPEVDVSKFDAKLLSGGQLDGKQYAVPLGSVAFGMVYDKAAMDKLGIANPANGWTWDDFFALAKESKSKLPEGQYFTLDYGGNYFMYSAYQYAKGKGQVITDDGHFNVDQAVFLEWTKKFEELRKEGLVPPADENASDKENDPQMDLLAAGKVLFRYSFSNNLGTWDSIKPGAYALVTMPRAEEAGGWLKPSMYLSVSENSKHAEEAKKFINWFVNDQEAGNILKTFRGLPANKEIATALEASMSDLDKVGLGLLRATEPDGQTWSAGAGGWTNFIDKDWVLVRDQLSFGKVTPEKAFEQLKEASQAYEK
ncbi:ABC transporter substrate-binding protein [Paenibacillus typhae]|uniref:ABC-type glycerol-3-phosphate transport system, substrate-binding protein n=1 Tax=Paenibacillus typhae TaxID=1174501 RepID=A0A1G8FP69_9BACL|nr:extracellular solute-binding protein [Paenibacillus typhae]SDH83894.1 ABC-type glycerol-3-phosphate transport system, substrate-binding protein [Paenibacillus typhae]